MICTFKAAKGIQYRLAWYTVKRLSVKLFPARESLVSDILTGDGKIINLFYSVGAGHLWYFPLQLLGYCIAQSTYICKVQSSVWSLPKYWPPPPLLPASVSSPRLWYTLAGRWGGGGSIFRKTPDIGLASYSIIPLRCIAYVITQITTDEPGRWSISPMPSLLSRLPPEEFLRLSFTAASRGTLDNRNHWGNTHKNLHQHPFQLWWPHTRILGKEEKERWIV